jgi:hypothetical protein
MIFNKPDFIIDPNKKYYCFYIKFSKSGFTRKITPIPCYLEKLSISHYKLFYDKEKIKELGYCYDDYVDYTSYSGIFETFEDCVNSFNNVINNRVGEITEDYNNHLNKLEKSLINI